MRKRNSWGRELFFAIMLTLICIGYFFTGSGSVNGGFLFIAFLAGHSWYKVVKLWPKS